jgi:hypothetical protein
MTYQIAIFNFGNLIDTVDGIEAHDALEAINRIEQQYKSKTVQLSGRNGEVHNYTWTGYEFQARRLDFYLS